MNWHHGDQSWLNGVYGEPEKKRNFAKWFVDGDFWAYVDSQQNANSHPGECFDHPTIPGARIWTWDFDGQQRFCSVWGHYRGGSDECLAAKSDLTRCGRPGSLGLPFCDFHFDNVWKQLHAKVGASQELAANQHLKSEMAFALSRVGLDQAAVDDAKNLLLKSNERVYFFLADHAVKVGRSIHPEKRVRTLSGTKAPEGVNVAAGVLLGTIPGGARTESALHLHFREHRLVGEWFAYEAVQADIDNLLAGRSEVAA